MPALHACVPPASSYAPAFNTQAQPILCLHSTLSGGADSRSHTLARHRDILHDFQQASRRLRLLSCNSKLSRLLQHSRHSAALSTGWLLWLVAVAAIGPSPHGLQVVFALFWFLPDAVCRRPSNTTGVPAAAVSGGSCTRPAGPAGRRRRQRAARAIAAGAPLAACHRSRLGWMAGCPGAAAAQPSIWLCSMLLLPLPQRRSTWHSFLPCRVSATAWGCCCGSAACWRAPTRRWMKSWAPRRSGWLQRPRVGCPVSWAVQPAMSHRGSV